MINSVSAEPTASVDLKVVDALDLARLRVPIMLKIGNEPAAEMTVSLLPCVRGQIPAEEVERLLPNAKLTAVADEAHDPRARKAFDDLCKSGVHFLRRDDLVADQAALRTVAVNPAAVHDGLAGKPIAKEPRQTQVRHAGNNSFLAGGQREIGTSFGQHVVHRKQMLTAATGREGIDHGNPRLLDSGALKLVGRGIGPRYSAKDLVFVAHYMLEVE